MTLFTPILMAFVLSVLFMSFISFVLFILFVSFVLFVMFISSAVSLKFYFCYSFINLFGDICPSYIFIFK